MANKMLIDASHPEETRVVVLSGNRVQEFDFEAADKRPLRGNIYLAKVTRVEPSLQAAFVDYGGNRHGFLAFAGPRLQACCDGRDAHHSCGSRQSGVHKGERGSASAPGHHREPVFISAP